MGNEYTEHCYVRNPDIATRQIAGEFILVPARQKAGEVASIYALNEVSFYIWEQIDGQNRVANIRDALVKEFEVGPKEAEQDLIELLTQMEQVGAIRKVRDDER